MSSSISGEKSPFSWKIDPEIIEHSITPVLGQQFSAKAFYAEIRQTLIAQKIPGLDIKDYHRSEGGPLSDDRLYLKIKRERLIFDVCAAPFGANYFFSYRLIESPPGFAWWHVALLCVGLGFSCWTIFHFIGTSGAPNLLILLGEHGRLVVPLALCVLLLLILIRRSFGQGMQFFRKDTFFREDSRIMYRNLVAEVIKATVARYTAEKGVKLVREFTYTPLLDLYRSTPVAPPSDEFAS